MPWMQATSAALTGVGTPTRAPARTTAPLMKSISVTEPFSRLCSIEVLNANGSPAAARSHASTGSLMPSRTPLARATAIASATAASAVSRSAGMAYSSP